MALAKAEPNSCGQLQANVQTEQPAGHGEIHNLVDDVEEQSQQEAGAGVFHVQLHSQRRCSVSDHRLGDAVHAQWAGE